MSLHGGGFLHVHDLLAADMSRAANRTLQVERAHGDLLLLPMRESEEACALKIFYGLRRLAANPGVDFVCLTAAALRARHFIGQHAV